MSEDKNNVSDEQAKFYKSCKEYYEAYHRVKHMSDRFTRNVTDSVERRARARKNEELKSNDAGQIVTLRQRSDADDNYRNDFGHDRLESSWNGRQDHGFQEYGQGVSGEMCNSVAGDNKIDFGTNTMPFRNEMGVYDESRSETESTGQMQSMNQPRNAFEQTDN